jgi:hypothetical protein
VLKMKVTQRGGAGPASKAVRAAAIAAATDVVRSWHDQYLPGHFTLEAVGKYGYQPRKGDNEPPRILVQRTAPSGQTYRTYRSNPHYSWRKRRQKGHNKPLVWSGQSERAAKQSVKLSARKTKGDEIKATAAMSLASYFYAYRKDLGQPDKADELTRVTPGEVLSLQGIYQTSFDANLTALTAAADRAAAQTIA